VFAIVCSLNENATVTKIMTIDWCNEVLLYNVSIVHHPFDTDYTNMFRHNLNQDYWLEIKCFGDHCLSFIDLRLQSTPISSVFRYHNFVLSLLMTYHRTFYNSNMTGATSGSDTA